MTGRLVKGATVAGKGLGGPGTRNDAPPGRPYRYQGRAGWDPAAVLYNGGDTGPGRGEENCGTVKGWWRHVRLAEKPCDPCWQAYKKGPRDAAAAVRPAVCSVPGCGRRPRGRGMCGAHYERWRRYGDPEAQGERRGCPTPLDGQDGGGS